MIGAYKQRRLEGGWHQPDELTASGFSFYEIDAEPSAEDPAILSALMSVGPQSALGFLA